MTSPAPVKPTETARPTPGPWETDRIAVRSSGPNGRQIALCEISVRGRAYDETYDEALANADLFAEAGTVLHETGLSPRQLADQRAELLDALRAIAKGYLGDQSAETQFIWAQDTARAAIARAEGRS